MTAAKPSIKRALISTSNKKGLAAFASQLHQLGIELIATGGTASHLRQAQIPVIDVQELTEFPEIMGGRVKTLHPKIHGGLLARRGIDDAVLIEQNITPIDLVIVNLYPFQKVISSAHCTQNEAVENIDIGGPTMIRAAAKNHDYVTVIIDPQDYSKVIEEIEKQGNTFIKTRQYLAQKAFAHTAEYDTAIAHYFMNQAEANLNLTLKKKMELRYGENPHQKATLYTQKKQIGSLTEAKQWQGKPLSFNNLMDSHAALSCLRALGENTPSCVIVKHATPCGAAQGNTLKAAYLKALATDTSSAFGGIIAFNHKLDEPTATTIIEKQFAEVILAPEFETNALRALSHKKNLRVLATGYCPPPHHATTFHSISGGLLIQEADNIPDDPSTYTVVTERQPTPSERADCLFAWNIVRYVTSNAIVYAKDYQTMGIGTGQTSRVFSAQIAALKAKAANLSLEGAVAASDAFYPFADGIEIAAKAGITAIIQPGGSLRDAEVIDAANQLNLAMVLTHVRHFKH